MAGLPEGYCIDTTEVTQGQYQAWLDGAPSVLGQPSECQWNGTYEPTCDWSPETKANYPVVCVDWCDARAYCLGVGKHLCGKIGGGANEYLDYHDATESEWHNACVSGFIDNAYPYGDSYMAEICNGYDHGLEATAAVRSLQHCQSSTTGYMEVFDLSGNVHEWEDSCDSEAGASDYCRLRGGSFTVEDSYLRCDSGSYDRRDLKEPSVGFRCCAG